MQKAIKLLALALFTVTLMGCKTSEPIYDVSRASIPTSNRTSLDSTGELIVKALHYKRWKVVSQDPGIIVASIDVRKHAATIEIKYDERSFAIKHMRSSLLKHDTGKQTIHRNYNKWIRLLEEEIYFRLRNPNAPMYEVH